MGKFNLAEHIQAAQPPKPRDIETITGEILDAKRAGGEAILTIGKGLIEAKALLSHGEWLPWLEERVEFSEKAAQRFMLLARKYSNPTALSDLGATKALMLLAIPDEAREEFISTSHVVNGEEKTVIDMTSRELDAAIKERDAARKAAEQAEADRRSADEAREKLSRDIALANERIAGLNAEVAEHSARAREAQDAAAQLEKELKELRSRPVDVAVETDTAAIEAARKEAEEKTRAVLERELKTAKAAAQEQVIRANEAEAQAKTELAQARRELEDLRFEAQRMEARVQLTSNEDLVLFRTLFDQAQEQINKLGGVLMKFRNKDAETAGKLQNALLALSDAVRKVAEG